MLLVGINGDDFMNILKWIAYSLVIIGAINWGLVGAFNFDLVSFLFGEMSTLSRIIYTIVGLCGIAYFVLSVRDNMECSGYNC